MKGKYIKILVIVSMLFVVSLIITASYAYFVANVSGNDSSYETVITTGKMALMLNEDNQVILNTALPGSSVSKTFSVKNTGTVDTVYDVYLSEILNTFVDKNDLVYTLTSATGCQTTSETVVPSVVGEQSKIVSSCSINAGETQEYTLTITFKETNDNQDDNKGKKFSAKISVNEYKEFGGIVAQLKDLKDSGSIDLEYDGVETLGVNGTEDNNLRYVGASPNNYIYFNCSTTNTSEMNDSTCEKWRIIGLFNNIEDNNGNKTSLVKIIRDQSLGYYSWDTSELSVNGGYGINQWGPSGTYEGADLMRELNTDYLGNITVGIDGKWYNGSKNSKTANIPSKTLNSNAQEMIQEVKWNTGSNESNNSSTWTTKNMYTYERSENTGKICSSGTNCNDSEIRTTSWIGKVALMYSSDYGYATRGGTTTNKETCLNTTLYNWDGSGVSDCKNNSWIYKSGSYQWTLSPRAYSNDANLVFDVYSDGDVHSTDAYNSNTVRPAVFLQSSITIAEGNGTSQTPYKLTM